jgi:PKHD-type hydroxylase
MLICIPEVLSKDEVLSLRAIIDPAPWVDGRATAGAQSGQVKRNQQVREDCAEAITAGNLVLDALGRCQTFVSAALPLKTFPPLFNRYEVGEGFGTHIDNAIRPVRGTSARVRTDLSATLFLSEPHDYEGGELIIETHAGAQEIKLPMGHMVLYPATSLHEVTPVTSGARVASFFWIQSMVRGESDRTLLFDLDQSIQSLARVMGGDHREVVKLTGLYHNLIRRWADA